MTDASLSGTGTMVESGVEPMVVVYCHDVHKARSRSHEHATDRFRGVRVNEEVPYGADGDAALLSRPYGSSEQTLDAHVSWRRVSLVTGDVVSTGDVDESLDDLVVIENAEQAHAAWLSSVPTVFNESPYYPYPSLKYHMLLAAALLDNYRSEFDELFLAVSERDDAGGPEVVPHRTVLTTPSFALHVTGTPDGRPAAQLGDVPARSFADAWARLLEFPFNVDGERRWRVLDAQLRRVRSWSAAMQYVEEYVAAFEPASSSRRGPGGDVRVE